MGEKEEPHVPQDAGPTLVAPNILLCQEWPQHCPAVSTGVSHQSSVFLNLQPGNVSRVEHWTVQIHEVSVTKEKRGTFLELL
jgi:hypothetical protein